MVRELLFTKRVLAGLLVLAAAGGTLIALKPLQSGGSSGSNVPTVAATRGDVVLTVGGVGRIVEAHSAGRIQVPTTAPGTPTPGSTASAQPTSAPADAVFATAAGHLSRFLVTPGAHVSAGQAIALVDDGGTAAVAVDQARADLDSARLDLAQKQTHDPTRGIPPTQAELRAARLAVTSAHDKLAQLAHPTPADLTSARLDVRKAQADLDTLTRPATAASLDAAQAAIDLAAQKLAQTTGPPLQTDVNAAQLELAKAQAELDTLKRAPSSTAVAAAQLAVTLAQQRISELPKSATPSEVTAAQLDLKKAQAELESLQRSTPAASLAAAQTAVDLATQKLAAITGPPTALAVASAQLDVKKAQAELATLQRGATRTAADAARLAVTLAKRKLAQLLHPARALRDAARSDAAKAAADLDVLSKRGGPATPGDIGIARLKVQAAASRLTLAETQAARLTVHAPTAGTVTALLAVPGAPTDPTTPIATIADLRHLAVSVDLSEFDAAQVHSGQSALVSVDALGGKKLPGTVLFEALTGVDNGGVVTFPARVSLPHAAGVKPGMNVSVRIIVAQRRNVVQVPLEAVSGDTVTVVRGGHTSTRHVTLGLADNKVVEIRSGLKPGERVLPASASGG